MLFNVKKLLKSSAEHYEEIKHALQIIADKDLDLAISLCRLINTEERRCEAFAECLEVYTDKVSTNNWNVNKIIEYTSEMNIDKYYSNTVMTILESAKEQIDDTRNNLSKIAKIIPLINRVESNTLKCTLITTSISILHFEPAVFVGIKPNYKNLVKDLEKFLLKFWNKIDIPWKKSTYGYRICSNIAKYNKGLAEDYYLKADQISMEQFIDNELHANTFFESIRLMIRFYSAIVSNDRDYKYDKIEYLIDLIPSRFEKAQLWAELSVKLRLVNAVELSNSIVSKKILPIVNYFVEKNEPTDYFSIMHICASAIHLSQPDTLKLFLEPLSIEKKEIIISVVCYVLITRHFEADPYSSSVGHSKFSYQDASDFLTLLESVNLDSDLFTHIRRLCYIGKQFPNNFVREQKTNIKSRLQKLVDSKLPDSKRGISHEGFKIVCEACIEHFSLNSSQTNTVFDKLAERGKLIDNVTDKAYVFSVLATECSISKKKKEFIEAAFNEADNMLSAKERIAMYFRFLDIAKEFHRELFNIKLKKVNEEIYKLDSTEMFPTFRKLIDVAYQVDKGIAQRIISTLDSDPARNKMVEPSNNYLDNLELEKTVLKDYEQFSKIRSRKNMEEVAWNMLGELNAKKRNAKEISQAYSIIRSASKIPFLQSIYLFEFFSQNAIRNESSRSLLIPFYEASYSNAKLVFDLICSLSSKSNNLSFNTYEHKDSFLAVPGSRHEAMNFIGSIIKESDSKDIYIVDPYFSELDMPFINDISNWSYGTKISVLTSSESKGEFSNDQYITSWNEISSENPPSVFFVKATNHHKQTPFHDRWILLYDKGIGIRLGTSINSIGGHKVSDISLMHSADVMERYDNVVVPLLVQRVREYKEHIIKYITFDL